MLAPEKMLFRCLHRPTHPADRKGSPKGFVLHKPPRLKTEPTPMPYLVPKTMHHLTSGRKKMLFVMLGGLRNMEHYVSDYA